MSKAIKSGLDKVVLHVLDTYWEHGLIIDVPELKRISKSISQEAYKRYLLEIKKRKPYVAKTFSECDQKRILAYVKAKNSVAVAFTLGDIIKNLKLKGFSYKDVLAFLRQSGLKIECPVGWFKSSKNKFISSTTWLHASK